MKNKTCFIYPSILFFLLCSLFIINQNCKKADNNSGTELLNELVGTWNGSWTDTKYNLSGSLNVTFTKNGDNISAIGTIDLSAFWLGDFPWTGTGTADGNTITFTFTASNFGNGNGVVTGTSATGSGSLIGTLNFGPYTFTGEIETSKISGNFIFTNTGGGEGVVSLVKN